MARHFSELSQFRSGGVRRASFLAPSGTFPFQGHAFGDEAIDRVRHVGEPGATPHFAIRDNVDSQFPLFLEDRENRAILGRAELFEGERARSVSRTSLQHLRRPQQTANMFSAIGLGMANTRPHSMKAGT